MRLHAGALVAAVTLCAGCSPALQLPADTIVVNGKVITVDPDDSITEALAIRDGKIVALGSTNEIEALAGDATRRIDLGGLTATPGLIDTHNHFAVGAVGALFTLDVSYPEVESITDVVEVVRTAVAESEPGEWITGGGWDEGKLEEQRYIYARDLDAVSPDNPVWLTHTTAHYSVGNSLALDLAGVTRDTPDPPGGVIDRQPDGTPTGVFKDTATSLVRRHIPSRDDDRLREAIERYVPELHKEGMTAIKDPEIGFRTWRAYQAVLASGKLTARVFVLWRVGRTVEDTHRLIEQVGPFTKPWITTGDDMLVSGGIKLYADGSGGARTAWLHDEWNKNLTEVDKGNYGVPRATPEVLREQIIAVHDAGLHLGVHAIGDRAIDVVVDAFADALEQNPAYGLRHSIIHSNIPTDAALDKIARLQADYDAVYPEVQPGFTWWIGDTYAGNFGPQRNQRLLGLKTYLDRGIRWGSGSDYDVTPFAARYGLWASVARETLMGTHGATPFGTEESVDIRLALRSYTAWNARQLFMEDRIGTLELGKYADIAVWDRDLYSVPTDQIKEMRCELTLVNGEIVYQAPQTRIRVEVK